MNRVDAPLLPSSPQNAASKLGASYLISGS
jgi:hypothetical protein